MQHEIRHGVSFAIKRDGVNFRMTFKAVGKLTHADYEKIVPLIDEALAQVDTPQINMFVDATELEGWELRAAWDDLRLGLKYGAAFNKIAILGRAKWMDYAAKIGAWFTSGDVRYFEDWDDALHWFNEK